MMAAARGIEDSIIKTLGRWESMAYLQKFLVASWQVTRTFWYHN